MPCLSPSNCLMRQQQQWRQRRLHKLTGVAGGVCTADHQQTRTLSTQPQDLHTHLVWCSAAEAVGCRCGCGGPDQLLGAGLQAHARACAAAARGPACCSAAPRAEGRARGAAAAHQLLLLLCLHAGDAKDMPTRKEFFFSERVHRTAGSTPRSSCGCTACGCNDLAWCSGQGESVLLLLSLPPVRLCSRVVVAAASGMRLIKGRAKSARSRGESEREGASVTAVAQEDADQPPSRPMHHYHHHHHSKMQRLHTATHHPQPAASSSSRAAGSYSGRSVCGRLLGAWRAQSASSALARHTRP